MLMQVMVSILVFAINGILIAFSKTAVAFLGIYFRVQSFIFMPVFGLCQGTMPILGYNYGARNKDRFMKTFWLAIKVGVFVMALGMAGQGTQVHTTEADDAGSVISPHRAVPATTTARAGR